MGFAATADPKRFDDAADWFLKRVVVTKAEAERLGIDAGRRAFWIGGGLQLEQIQRVFDKLNAANDQGLPFEEWRKQVKSELRNDAHAETVFRNATQRALNAGRWHQMREEGVLAFRPYVLFDGIEDIRQSDICRACNGTIVPLESEWARTHVPPLHHRCRSCLRNLRKAEAERRGISTVPPLQDADPGFGAAPDDDAVWKPNPAKTDPKLLAELERKKGQRPAPVPPVTAPKEHDPKHWEREYEPRYGAAAPSVGWGRAMLERGLDRSGADVAAELQRLRDAGHPSAQGSGGGAAIGQLKALGNRPVRGSLPGNSHRHLVALAEHTRSIKVGEKLALAGPARVPASTRAFYDLSLDASVRRPNDWTISVSSSADSSFASPSTRAIVMRSAAGESIWTHEVAHAIETVNVQTLQRSLAFVDQRAAGEKIRPLVGERATDVGRPDKFTRPYVGRDYGRGATEVTSMGYQWLHESRGDHFDKLLSHDEEHVLFLLGQLAGR